MPSNHLILCRPLLLPPSIFPRIKVFSSESFLCIRWSNYWNFSLSISPSNDYSGLISCRIDWFNLLAVQRTLTSLIQHHSSKISILLSSTFFMVHLSHPYDSWKNCGSGGGLVTKSCPTLGIPRTVACQVPLSMGFSRQEYWSGLPFSSPGDLPDPATEPGSPALQTDSLPTELQGKPFD